MEGFQSGGRAIRVEFAPPPSPGPHPAVLLLHGSGGNTGFWLQRFAPFACQAGLGLFAVHYFDRTGTSRANAADILDGHHFPLWAETIRDALSFLSRHPAVDPARIALVGVSLGAFLGVAVSATDRRVRALVEISGGLPSPFAPDLPRQFPPTLLLHGQADTVVPVAQARDLDLALTDAGVPHRLRVLPGEGHWLSPAGQAILLSEVGLFLRRHLAPTAPPTSTVPTAGARP